MSEAELSGMIGSEALPMEVVVTLDAVDRFARATGDPAAPGSVPPTFPAVFRPRFPDDFRSRFARIVHAEQSFRYHRLLHVGQRLRITAAIRDVYAKEGRSGRLVFIVVRTEGRAVDASRGLVYEAVATLIGQS